MTQSDLDRARFRIDLAEVARKSRVNIMLDTGIVAFFKARSAGRGYQTLINETLKRAVQREDLEKTIRRIVREELAHAR